MQLRTCSCAPDLVPCSYHILRPEGSSSYRLDPTIEFSSPQLSQGTYAADPTGRNARSQGRAMGKPGNAAARTLHRQCRASFAMPPARLLEVSNRPFNHSTIEGLRASILHRRSFDAVRRGWQNNRLQFDTRLVASTCGSLYPNPSASLAVARDADLRGSTRFRHPPSLVNS